MTLTLASWGEVTSDVLPWQLPVAHLSASSLKMAMRCPRQWQERYIHHRKQRPGAAGTLGTAEWNAHVLNYTQKLETGIDLPAIDDAFAESWDQAVERDGGIGEISWNANERWQDVQAQGLKMARLYHEQVSPRTQPVAVEKKVEIEMTGTPVPILGFIDLVKLHSTVEHKTGRAMRKPKTEWIFQQKVYAVATRMPGEIHLVTKAKEPKVITPLESDVFTVPHTDATAANTELLVSKTAWFLNYLYATLGPDEPWPQFGVISDWACDWCAYRGDCPAWRNT